MSAPGSDRLGELATSAHPAVGDDRHVPAGLIEVGVASGRDIADGGHLRHPDAEHLARRARGARPDPHEHGGGTLFHEREGCVRVRRVADRDRDGHVAGELGERQRVVLARDVAGRRDLALHEEEVGTVLRAEWSEAARDGRGRRDRRFRARRMDRLDPRRDQVLADGLSVGLGKDVVDIGIGCRGDPLEHLVGIVEPSLDPLEIEDGQAAEPCQLPGHPRIDDRVHRRGEDGDRQVDAAERLGEVDVGRLDRIGARRERDILEAVRRTDGVDLGPEGAACGRRSACFGYVGPVDHVALPAASRWAASTPSLPRTVGRRARTGHDGRGLRSPSIVNSNQIARSGSVRSSRIRSMAVR